MNKRVILNIDMGKWFKDHNPLDFLRDFFEYSLRSKDGIYVVYILVVVVIGVLYYFWSAEVVKKSLAEQMLYREQTISRAGAKSIEYFLRDVGRTEELLARKPTVVAMTPDAQGTLERFIEDWRDTAVVAVIITNSKGNVLFDANKLSAPFEKGISVADRDYFVWAKGANQGQIYWGKAIVSRLGLTKGQYVIPIATPIIKNGEFRGALVGVISVAELSKSTLDPLKISDATQIYVVNSNGDFLVSYYPQLTGVNMLDYLKQHPFPGSGLIISIIESRLGTKFEGKLDTAYPDLNHDNKLTRFLLAYSPVLVGDQNWSLIIVTPAEDAFAFRGPLYRDQLFVLIFFILSILGYALISIYLSKHSVRDAYLKGFKEGVKHHSP